MQSIMQVKFIVIVVLRVALFPYLHFANFAGKGLRFMGFPSYSPLPTSINLARMEVYNIVSSNHYVLVIGSEIM